MYALKRKKFEPITILGIVATLLLHVGAVAGVILHRRALQAAQKPPPPPSYVVARLIRKGKKNPDKKRLPDKIVPQQSTMKKRAVDLTADANDAPNKKKKRDRAVKVSDRNKSALDKLELLAKAQKEIEGEGDPDGVVGGSATGKAGDRYMTRIADIWNRTWSLPAVIPPDRAKRLHVLVVINIDKSGRIRFPIQFDRRSGNPHFDSSIQLAWQRIKRIPIPPPDRLASILANGLALKLNWRGLQ